MNNSIFDTVRGLAEDGILLVRQEVRLARSEISEKVEQLQGGLIFIVAGMMLFFCALLIFAQALVIALANVVGDWAALIVGGILLIAAALVVWKGARMLRPRNLTPHRTAQSLRKSADTLKESV